MEHILWNVSLGFVNIYVELDRTLKAICHNFDFVINFLVKKKLWKISKNIKHKVIAEIPFVFVTD